MQVPVWEWMIRKGHNPYVARESLGLESNDETPGNPDWCFHRMGAARVEMPDGRVMTIGGEHEDYYDPDFCIYNDVIVQKGDDIQIYGYPRSTFPPTDFHTATLVEGDIYIIGGLGYKEERGGSTTPVFRLDTNDYHIECVVTTGDSPGWIHEHHAQYLADIGVIEVTGGELILRDGDSERFRDNFDTYHLKIEEGTWHRITDHSAWRQFSLEYADDERAWDDMGWYTGEVLRKLGYPCELYDEDEDEDQEELSEPSHVLIVDSVRVLCADRDGEIRITIQGQLEQAQVDDLLAKLTDLARSTHRVVTKVTEL
jgi:hypothetical protein